jgi:hypothetical protein
MLACFFSLEITSDTDEVTATLGRLKALRLKKRSARMFLMWLWRLHRIDDNYV